MKKASHVSIKRISNFKIYFNGTINLRSNQIKNYFLAKSFISSIIKDINYYFKNKFRNIKITIING
jgi:hypothetical protein